MSQARIQPEKHGRGVEAAWRMLDLFASLGVPAFDVTRTDVGGHLRGFRGAVRGERLRRELPHLLQAALEQQHNLILRPRQAPVRLIQLDDLGDALVERLRAAAFLILATSVGNHQAWVAVEACAAGFARQLRRGSGADPSASGATRLAGSLNFKRQYAPDFPTVRLLAGAPQRIVTAGQLEALGLVAGPESMAVSRPPGLAAGRCAKRWPSYQRCLENAPGARDGQRPDVSRADFTFCLLAMDWGWSMAETGARLLQNSRKARENGVAYVRLTVARAAAALDGRRRTTAHLR